MTNTIQNMLLGLFFLGTCLIQAQSSFEAGIFFGGTNYYGELSKTHGSFEEVGTGFGAWTRYMFNRNLGVKGVAGIMQLMGKDETAEKHIERDWRMMNDIIEISAQIEYHPLGQGRRNIVGQFNKNQFSPYVFFGAGFSVGEAKVVVPERDKGLFPEMGQSNGFLVVPIGGGIRYDIDKYFMISLELGKRMVLSDYLDGISINGVSSTNDWYMFGGLFISILINAESDRRY